jgi:hypothetical protein
MANKAWSHRDAGVASATTLGCVLLGDASFVSGWAQGSTIGLTKWPYVTLIAIPTVCVLLVSHKTRASRKTLLRDWAAVTFGNVIGAAWYFFRYVPKGERAIKIAWIAGIVLHQALFRCFDVYRQSLLTGFLEGVLLLYFIYRVEKRFWRLRRRNPPPDAVLAPE